MINSGYHSDQQNSPFKAQTEAGVEHKDGETMHVWCINSINNHADQDFDNEHDAGDQVSETKTSAYLPHYQ